MRKFKNFLWKTFFPMSYKCNEIAKADRAKDPEPTVSELVKLLADITNENLIAFSDAIVRRFYNEWVESISNNSYLNRYEFVFYVFLRDDRKFMLNCWVRTFDIIMKEHPKLFIDADVCNEKIIAHVTYKDCLDDKIDIKGIRDNKLIQNWMKRHV